MHTQSIPLSDLLGSRVHGPDGAVLGRVREVALCPQDDAQHVTAFIVRTAQGDRLLGPKKLQSISRDGLVTKSGDAEDLPPLASSEGFLMLERDLLDQQIIDVKGRKVVRVNDANLTADTHHDGDKSVQVRVSEVEVGTRGALRRLLKGFAPRAAVDNFVDKFAAKAIPWQFVDMIETDPSRRVRLKIDQARLGKLHPADIADILEDLAPAERAAVFESLDEGVAAEALEELDDPKLQASLLRSIGSEHAADIVEEMDPDVAADVLGDLPKEQSDQILGQMEPEEREEVTGLLSFREDTAAGRMTTDFIWTYDDHSVAQAIKVLRDYEGQIESIYTVFLVDGEKRLTGAVPLSKLVTADPEIPLAELKHEPLVWCDAETRELEVAELFDKYNLLMLPVIDDDLHIAGVITVDDVISLLRDKI